MTETFKTPVQTSYQWIIAFCCFLLMFANVGLVATTFNVYQPYLVAIPAVGDAGGSIILTVRAAVSFVTLLFVGKLIHLFDVKAVAFLACLLTAAGFLVYSQASSMAVFLLGAVLTGVGYSCGGMVGITILLNRWFPANMGTAVGFTAVGSGICNIIIPTAVTAIISRANLSAAFLLGAGISLVTGVLVLLLMRNRPDAVAKASILHAGKPEAESSSTASIREEGAKEAEKDALVTSSTQESNSSPSSEETVSQVSAYNTESSGESQMSSSAEQGEDWRPSTRTLAALCIAMALMGGTAVGGSSYMSVNLVTEGFDVVLAGYLLSGTGIILTVCKILAGRMFDSWGAAKTTAFFGVVLCLSMLCGALMPLKLLALAVAAPLLYGVGATLASVGVPLWSVDLSDQKHRAKNIQRFQTWYAAGAMAFNLLPGLLKSATGTYATTYGILLVAMAVCLAILLFAYRQKGAASN